MSAEDTSTGPEGEAVAKNDGEEEAAVPTQDAIKHIVKDGDTINSIAAHYDLTPSILCQSNKLSTKMVFPGQVLNIPPQPPTPPPAPAVKEIKKKVVKPLVEESEIFEQQFIKVNVRHITDGSGVVIGSLLITPKMVMFNPNEGDLLVQESEPDNYQLILPFELLVNIAIFKDFSRFNSTIGIANKEENSNDLFEDTEKDTDGEKENKGEEEKTLYMRLVMGKPIAKKLPRSTPVVSYGTQDLQPEYWFLLKGVTARKLHSFIINDLCPDKYGLLDHMEIGRRGYEVLRTGTAVFEDDSGKGCNRETVSQMFQNQMQMASFDVECITEQIGSSDIFEPPERERISRELPPKATGFNWELGYSTSEHGFNLHSLYRKMQKFEGPCLLLIQDIGSQNVFGAYLTARPQMSEHFLGTGETFVFTLRPKFEAFHWTGENDFFMKGEPRNFIIGSANGKFALWIDEDLNQGRTESCSTFDNQPLTTEDFTIKALECWAFV